MINRISPILDPLSLPMVVPATIGQRGRRIADTTQPRDFQEPEDAVFTIIEEAPPLALPVRSQERRKRTRISAAMRSVRSFPNAALYTTAQLTVLKAYTPYQEYVGTLVDAWG